MKNNKLNKMKDKINMNHFMHRYPIHTVHKYLPKDSNNQHDMINTYSLLDKSDKEMNKSRMSVSKLGNSN